LTIGLIKHKNKGRNRNSPSIKELSLRKCRNAKKDENGENAGASGVYQSECKNGLSGDALCEQQ
jgi:hypothetical protein